MEAADVMELPKDEQKELIDIVACVLHLGNIIFGIDENSKSVVIENHHLRAISTVNFNKKEIQKFDYIFLDTWNPH